MATQRSVEVRVGIFVIICLVAGAGLIWQFGKLSPATKRSYQLAVMFDNVGGLIRDAGVMYAGVSVGKVRDITLVEHGGRLRARVTLNVFEGVTVRKDAKFVINQSGLLGDRYVDVIPGSATAPPLPAGAEVEGTPSVDLTEAIRSVTEVLQQAAGTIKRVDALIARVDGLVVHVDESAVVVRDALRRVDEVVLSTQNLQQVSATLANVQTATSNAVLLSQSLRGLVDEGRASVTNTLGQLAVAADNVNQTLRRIDGVVVAAETNVHASLQNITASTARLNAILDKLDQGEGTVGKLLTDPTLHDEVVRLVRNLRQYGLLYREGTRPRAAADTPRSPELTGPGGRPPVPARPAGGTKP